jgi:hypothetical protein
MTNLLLTRLPMPVKVGVPIGAHASTTPTGGSTAGGMNMSACSGECGCALPDGAPAELGEAA